MKMLPNKIILSGNLLQSFSYFNPYPSKWEPILEQFGLNFDFVKEENPKMSLFISTDQNFENLNINISEEMVTCREIYLIS